MSPEREEAELLLGRAREGQAVVAKFGSGLADSVIGFHGQQAVEKALQAVLSAGGDEYPWTHDLSFLIERLEAAGVRVPERVTAARVLGPWAVEFRYGETIGEALDRAAAVRLVGGAIEWASEQVPERAG